MPQSNADAKSLALELTEIGLSLFSCEGDVPLECVCHVALDDPDFASKVGGFRKAAQEVAGKDFSTEIWLPDDQVTMRSVMLEADTGKDPRTLAASALSASTPFPGTTLCFDLGAVNGAGYTPVAAIPREKMDEALAFARKIRMNPVAVSTSNVVAGFSSRPSFEPHVDVIPKRPAHVRMAALTAVLAAPILLLSAEMDRGTGDIPFTAPTAYVASVEHRVDPAFASDFAAPPAFAATSVDRRSPAPLAGPAIDPAPQTLMMADVDVMGAAPVQPMDVAETSVSVTLPSELAPATTAALPLGGSMQVRAVDQVFAVTSVAQPFAPINADLAPVVGWGIDQGYRFEAPTVATLATPSLEDARPDSSMANIDYVQNLFGADIVIQDLMAVEEPAAEAGDLADAPQFVQVANIAVGARPTLRDAPRRRFQPSLAARPELRPSSEPPAGAPATVADAGLGTYVADENETRVPVALDAVAATPAPQAPDATVFPDVAQSIEMTEALRMQEARDAALDLVDELDALIVRPKRRDVAQVPGPEGGLVQLEIADSLPRYEIQPPDIIAPQSTAQTRPPMPPVRLAALDVSERRFDRPAAAATQVDADIAGSAPAAVLRKPFPRGTSAQNQVIASLTPQSAVVLKRPPARDNDTVATPVRPEIPLRTLDEIVAAHVTQHRLDRPDGRPAGAVDVAALTQPETADAAPAGVAAAIAASVTELRLQRPPARPDREAVVVAALTPPVVDVTASKYAIPLAYAPVGRPKSLAAAAAKIVAARQSVAKQVEQKQAPAQTTPTNRLRIPTAARVASTATIKDGIALGDVSLIGIYGSKRTRHALVRLPQGTFVRISRGDSFSGWTVSAVGEDAVRIQKGGTSKILRLPN